jgi:hypothetical protein
MGKGDYNKGQRDGSRGKYQRPAGLLQDLLSTGSNRRDNIRRNSDYDKGYSNGKKNPKKPR